MIWVFVAKPQLPQTSDMAAVDVFGTLASAPSYSSGRIARLSDGALTPILYMLSNALYKGLLSVTAITSQRDLERGIRRKCSVQHVVQDRSDGTTIVTGIPVDLGSNVLLTSPSKDGERMAVIRTGDDKAMFAEVWGIDGMEVCVPLAGKHGDVYSDCASNLLNMK